MSMNKFVIWINKDNYFAVIDNNLFYDKYSKDRVQIPISDIKHGADFLEIRNNKYSYRVFNTFIDYDFRKYEAIYLYKGQVLILRIDKNYSLLITPMVEVLFGDDV